MPSGPEVIAQGFAGGDGIVRALSNSTATDLAAGRLDRCPEPADPAVWISAAGRADLPGINRFVNGMTADLGAVVAGPSQPFSSGPVEGDVNRIKGLERQMHGSAGFDLLRKRVLLAG